MHAGETKIQTIIDNQRQYVIPLFQRPYSWESPHWACKRWPSSPNTTPSSCALRRRSE
jgi:hypothetical protein